MADGSGKEAIASGGIEKIRGARLEPETTVPGTATSEDVERSLGRSLPGRAYLECYVEPVPPVVAVHVSGLGRPWEEAILEAPPPCVLIRDFHYSCECDEVGGRECLGHGEVWLALARQGESADAQKQAGEPECPEGSHARWDRG